MVKESFTAIVTASIPEGLPAYSVVACDINIDPAIGPKKEHDVPSDRAWVIEDVFVTADQSVDGLVRFVKNGEIVLDQVGPVNTLNVSNPARPKAPTKPLVYEPGSKLSISYVTLAAGPVGGATVTFYVRVRQVTAARARRTAGVRGLAARIRAALA